jgi:nucleoid-associated protein YgaU
LLIPNINNEEKVTVNEAKDNTDITTSSSYTVKKGDSLWTIAVQEYGDGYKWTEIAKINNLTHPNIIHIGNVLVLP